MSKNYQEFKEKLFDGNTVLKQEYDVLKIEKEIREKLLRNRKERAISKKELAEKSRINIEKIKRFEKGNYDIKLRELIKIADILDIRTEFITKKEISNFEKFVFIDGENYIVSNDRMPIKDEYYYYIYLNKMTEEYYAPAPDYIKEIKSKKNVTIKYVDTRSKNLVDIMIERDISYIFYNYNKKAEISIISSDCGFDNYIRNFNILTPDTIILRRINRELNIYEKLEEDAETEIKILKFGEYVVSMLKKNITMLPKDIKSLSHTISSLIAGSNEDIKTRCVVNYLEEKGHIFIEPAKRNENPRVFYRLH